MWSLKVLQIDWYHTNWCPSRSDSHVGFFGSCTLCYAAWPWDQAHRQWGFCHGWHFLNENKFLIVKHQTRYPYTTVISQFLPPPPPPRHKRDIPQNTNVDLVASKDVLNFVVWPQASWLESTRKLPFDHWFSVHCRLMTSCLLNQTNWRIISIKTLQQWIESPLNLFTNCLSWPLFCRLAESHGDDSTHICPPWHISNVGSQKKRQGSQMPGNMQWLRCLRGVICCRCCLYLWFWEWYLCCIIFGDLLCSDAFIKHPDPGWCTWVTWVWILPVEVKVGSAWFAHWFMANSNCLGADQPGELLIHFR